MWPSCSCRLDRQGDPALAVGFRLVHRDVGVAQDLVRLAIPKVAERYADAREGSQLGAVHARRLLECFEQALAQRHDVVLPVNAFQQHGELVAAEPRHQIVWPHARIEAPRDILE